MLAEELIPYNLALSMKQLGFNELCYGYYEHTKPTSPVTSNLKNEEIWLGELDCTAPHWLQAQEWILKTYDIYLTIIPDLSTAGYYKIYIVGPFIAKTLHERAVLWEGDGVLRQYQNAKEYILAKALEILTTGIYKSTN